MTLPARLTASVAVTVLAVTGCSSGGKDAKSAPTKGKSITASCSAGKAPSFGARPSAFDAPVSVESTGALSTQVSEPTLSSSPAPSEGFKVAELKVSARVLTNGVFALHPEAFVLADREGNVCGQLTTNPLKNKLQPSQVDESHAASGSIAFLVPSEANLSDYTVYYLDRAGAPRAVAAWSGKGAAPTAATAVTCSTNKSGISLDGAKDHEFGQPFRSGDDTIALTITPSAPTSRDLKPGPNQPNDVRGVVVSIEAAAKGSAGFIERDQFQLIDDKGNLCRYNDLGSDGETLSSDLLDSGKSQTYTVVFWTPKTSEVAGWKLLYMPEPSDKKVTATWTLKPATSSTPAPSSAASSAVPSLSTPSPTKSTT